MKSKIKMKHFMSQVRKACDESPNVSEDIAAAIEFIDIHCENDEEEVYLGDVVLMLLEAQSSHHELMMEELEADSRETEGQHDAALEALETIRTIANNAVV